MTRTHSAMRSSVHCRRGIFTMRTSSFENGTQEPAGLAKMSGTFLSFLPAKTRTSQDIFALGNRFEMFGIHATTLAAQMINLQTRRNRPLKMFVAPTVRRHPFAGTNYKLTVPSASAARYPQPTPGVGFWAKQILKAIPDLTLARALVALL